MTLFRHLVPAAAALVLSVGCGGPAASSTSPQPAGTTPSAAASVSAPAGAGVLTVAPGGTAPRGTAWYVRIESMAAKPLVEEAFLNRPVVLSHPLPVGRYRVVSWWRACSAACPSSGEAGLGPLEEVCGAVASVRSGVTTRAVLRFTPDGGCAVDVRP